MSAPMKYKVCISIPVHEAPDVVVEQIKNIRHYYNNECVIVLHLSRNFEMPEQIDPDRAYNFIDMEGVIINPYSYPTKWGDIMYLHNSNFRYACSVVDFDYFILHASNDLYIRHGAIEYIEKVKNGSSPIYFENWDWSVIMDQDQAFKNLLTYMGAERPFISPVEGSFYLKETFQQMLDIIDRFYEEGDGPLYPREETFYPTVLKLLNADYGSPVVLAPHFVKEPISLDTLFQIRFGIYQSEKASQFYDPSNLFAVKGVPRDYNHLFRHVIRGIM